MINIFQKAKMSKESLLMDYNSNSHQFFEFSGSNKTKAQRCWSCI